jgi:cell migration-inducing and hyaluronan-binding protein
MQTSGRSFVFSLLVTASFSVGVCLNAQAQEHDHGAAQAQDASAVTVRGGRWSDPATWSGGAVPVAGDIVTIGEGMDVVLDVSPPALHGMNLNGNLSFADDKDLELTTEWILMRGELHVGSESRPHTRNATITLTDNVPGENINGMGDRGILIVGGTLSLHGDRENAWTKLAELPRPAAPVSKCSMPAAGGSVTKSSWPLRTSIPGRQRLASITAISGNTMTLDQPLEYMHFGEITYGVDQRGEVGLLTRNVRVQASADAEETYFGGHIMAMAGSTMKVSGVALTRMGQHLELARYPIHWHLNGDVTGQYIRNSAIYDTFNRCVTIHGTDNLLVENNVTYNTVGHCFFMEDGIETGNRLVRNLGIQTKCHPTLPCVPTNLGIPSDPGGQGQQSEHVLLPSDNTVATFWITNPSNDYIDNVAAGSDSIGFWFSLPEHPNGAFLGTEISAEHLATSHAAGEFRGNVAHSNFDGLMFDRNINADNTFGVTGSSHIARENPADPNSRSIESVIEDFTAYKNRNGGIWGRGEMKVYRNLKLADNAIGFTHASGSAGRTPLRQGSLIRCSWAKPTTSAIRARLRKSPTAAACRKRVADFPIRGYEYYDYLQEVVNTTFINYEDNDTREAGAISYLLYTSFGMHTRNSAEGLRIHQRQAGALS